MLEAETELVLLQATLFDLGEPPAAAGWQGTAAAAGCGVKEDQTTPLGDALGARRCSHGSP